MYFFLCFQCSSLVQFVIGKIVGVETKTVEIYVVRTKKVISHWEMRQKISAIKFLYRISKKVLFKLHFERRYT